MINAPEDLRIVKKITVNWKLNFIYGLAVKAKMVIVPFCIKVWSIDQASFDFDHFMGTCETLKPNFMQNGNLTNLHAHKNNSKFPVAHAQYAFDG